MKKLDFLKFVHGVQSIQLNGGIQLKTVITYGTFDLIHHGHIRLLERAKALGDYLIVAVTSEDFDKSRGKINAVQSLDERIENVRKTGLADKIIVEEYEGQKIDDVKKYNVDIFTVGSDWVGKFDYLKKYCEVIYLDRTKGVSSSSIRSSNNRVKIGFIGDYPPMLKYMDECNYVNGLEVSGVVSTDQSILKYAKSKDIPIFNSINKLLDCVDAIYIVSDPNLHYQQIKIAFNYNKHVICQSPISLNIGEFIELQKEAKSKNLILMDAIKTNYSLAFNRMCLLIETGKIGDVVSIDSTCTVMREKPIEGWNSICTWGPVSLLPIFRILGNSPKDVTIISKMNDSYYDAFTKINLLYDHAVASVKIGIGIKSEGEMIISGTKGYIYVPAPWWKTDYFEIRYENIVENKRYFYELLGEGTRAMLHEFLMCINKKSIDENNYSESIILCIQKFLDGNKIDI